MLFRNFKVFGPNLGPAASRLFISVFLLTALACGESPAPQQDSWRLVPPEIIGTTADGRSNQKSTKEANVTKDSLQFNLDSYLKFSTADRGLSLKFETHCGDLTFMGELITADVVSLARMMPPQALGDTQAGSQCRISIAVTNQLGSVHQFHLQNVRLAANALEAEKQHFIHGPSKWMKSEPLRLVCGTWWNEENSESINAAMSLDSRVSALGTSKTVMGIDDRGRRFRPNCRVFQLNGDSGMSLIQSLTFSLPGLESQLSKSIVLQPQNPFTFLISPLVEWTLKNTSPRRQIVFITSRKQSLKMSYYNRLPQLAIGWSKMISVPYEFHIQAGHRSVETAEGTYIELLAGQALKMQLKLNLEATCLVNFTKQNTPLLRFEMSQPIQYALANQDFELEQLNSIGNRVEIEALKNLFSSQVIEFGAVPQEMTDAGTISEAAASRGYGLQSPENLQSHCYRGISYGIPESTRSLIEN